MKFDIIAGHYFVHQHDPYKKPNLIDKLSLEAKPDTMGISELLKIVAGLLSAMVSAIAKHQDISNLLDQFEALIGGASVQSAITLKEGKEASAEIKDLIKQVLKDLDGTKANETASETKMNQLSLNPL